MAQALCYREDMTGSDGWVLPDEPVAVRLMNTVWADRHGVHDSLRTARDLRSWLRATGYRVGPVRRGDVEAFRTLRDALRRLAALATADERPAAASPTRDEGEAVRQVNAAVQASPVGSLLRLRVGKLERDALSVDTAPRARSAVAAAGVELLTGTVPSIRACPAPGCVLYFVRDHPRREWCSTGCGNRVRAARYYRRLRAGSEGRSDQGRA